MVDDEGLQIADEESSEEGEDHIRVYDARYKIPATSGGGVGMKNKSGSFESRWYRLKSTCLDFFKKFASIIIVISMAFTCLLTIGIFSSQVYNLA